MVIWGIFGGVATIYGPVVAVFILYPLTEWLGSFKQVGELRLLIFAVIVLLVLLFMPRGLAPWVRDKIEIAMPALQAEKRQAGSRLPAVRRAAKDPGNPRAASRRPSVACRPLGEDAPLRQHVVAVGHAEDLAHLLLDQQHRHAVGCGCSRWRRTAPRG